MSDKFEEKNHDQDKEYAEFVRSGVEDKSYFKDALNWYLFRYVSPICDRSLLIIGSIIAGVVMFLLVQMVRSAFPLVMQAPIFIEAKDQSTYLPKLVALKPKKNDPGYDEKIKTVDEAVAKYLLGNYVKIRESYDYRKGDIADVNSKFAAIKNSSSTSELRNFQALMSRDNPDSPIQNFGKNVKRDVVIESIKLIKQEPKDFATKARQYLSDKLPVEAEVKFKTVTKFISDDAQKSEELRFVAKIYFSLSGVSVAEKESKPNLSFVVNGYKLYKAQ